MTEPWNWTKDDLKQLIGQAESIRLDFKQSKLFDSSREQIADNLTREVSAFANTEGGVIVIGIVERKEGKSRIASNIDDGVDISSWSGERIQQLVESNVSPYLTGLRVKQIPLDIGKTKFAYSIYVPAGTTAYQASDHRYYGRSEFESKSLPDHEVRLRMFRGKAVNARIRVVNCHIKDITATPEGLKGHYHYKLSSIWDKLDEHILDEKKSIREYSFSLEVENTGEINISEFKVQLEFPHGNLFGFEPYLMAVKDGWAFPLTRGFLSEKPETQQFMHVNIYPQDVCLVYNDIFSLRQWDDIRDYNLIISWTLFLSNSLPISGQIDLADVFEQGNRNDKIGDVQE